METLRVEDLINQAIQQGKIVQGINDPESLEHIVRAASTGNLPLHGWRTDLGKSSGLADLNLMWESFLEATRQRIHHAHLASSVCDMVTAQKAFEAATAQFISHLLEQERHERSPEVELLGKALRIAGSPERLAQWMQTPVPALNGQTPYSLMQTEEGRKQVEEVLGRIEHGVY